MWLKACPQDDILNIPSNIYIFTTFNIPAYWKAHIVFSKCQSCPRLWHWLSVQSGFWPQWSLQPSSSELQWDSGLRWLLWNVCKSDYNTLWVVLTIREAIVAWRSDGSSELSSHKHMHFICSEAKTVHLLPGPACTQHPSPNTCTRHSQVGFLPLSGFFAELSWI